jgi:predicted DNA-binding protein
MPRARRYEKKLLLRVTEEFCERVKAVAGRGRVAVFVREAAEEKLASLNHDPGAARKGSH